jgi:hypothetical protein
MMTIKAKDVIELFNPCESYDEYLEANIITPTTTLKQVLESRLIYTHHKEWLADKILMQIKSSYVDVSLFLFDYNRKVEVNYCTEDMIYLSKGTFTLKVVIPYLEECAYYLLYEQDEEEE